MPSVSPASALVLAYVSMADSREIYVLELSPADGNLRLVEKFAAGGMVMPLAVRPDRRVLFAALRSDPYSVLSLAVDSSSGKLTPIGAAPLVDSMAYISTDHTGRWLFAASYSGSRISVNAIRPDGAVDPTPVHVLPTGKNAHAIAVDPSNRFVFVTNLGDDQILQFRFDAGTGQLSPNTPPAVKFPKGAGPRHFVFHPNGDFVFCCNELDGTVSTLRLESTGILTMLDSVSVMPPGLAGGVPWTADIHLTENGRFLYVSERTSSTLAAFSIGAPNGGLARIGSYPTETQPRGFNIDPQGRYLLAAGQKSNGLSVHEIDQSTGALRTVSRLDVGKNPNWVTIFSLP